MTTQTAPARRRTRLADIDARSEAAQKRLRRVLGTTKVRPVQASTFNSAL